MKFNQVLILSTLLAVANSAPFNLRRREQSVACSIPELTEFACGLLDDTTGATVCRDGFTACINPGDHGEDDTCGPCKEIETKEEPRVEEPTVELPLCSTVDVADFSCTLTDGSTGALVCHAGFTGCKGLDDIEGDDSCGCCPGDTTGRCTPTVASRTMNPPVCNATELVENTCDLADGSDGATVCRHGFTACINAEALHADDICGVCATVATPEEPRMDVPEVPLPICSEVELADFSCVLTDGSTGALVCNKGFTACMSTAEIEDDFSCGCCSGDDSPRCQELEEPRLISLEAVSEASLACSATELEFNSCNITGSGIVGSTVCRNGFTACIQSEAHLATDTCGQCPIILAPEEVRGDEGSLIEAKDSKCTDEKIAEFDCSLKDGSVGVYTCRFGFTSCVAVDTLTESSACGCCPGDDLDGCSSEKDTPVLSARNADFDLP